MFSILTPAHSHRSPLGSARNSGLLHGLIVPSFVAQRCPFISPSVGDVLLVMASESHRFILIGAPNPLSSWQCLGFRASTSIDGRVAFRFGENTRADSKLRLAFVTPPAGLLGLSFLGRQFLLLRLLLFLIPQIAPALGH